MKTFENTELLVAQDACFKAFKAAFGDEQYLRAEMVGSASIHGRGEDIDFVFLKKPGEEPLFMAEPPIGWHVGGSAQASDKWEVWSAELAATGARLNLILTEDPQVFETWRASTEVCKALVARGVPVNKFLRVALHRIIQEGKSANSCWPSDIDEATP